MKSYRIILNIIIILFPFALVFGAKTEKANEKFNFINEIYNESWALIIGINKYENVNRLNFAVNDANVIKKLLIEKYGFPEKNIRFLTDKQATKNNIMAAFNEILLTAGDQDRVVVFYAGHGDTYKLPGGGDMGYLIPVDGYASKEKIFLTSIPMSSIEQISTMSAAKHILFLVDACYGGLTLNTRSLGKEQTPEYLEKMTKQKGRQVITAGGKDEQVMEKAEWGHSAFTKSLISGLENDLADTNYDGIISGEELGTYIRSGVAIDTKGQHTPQNGRLGSDPGEFIFISQTLQEDVAELDTEKEIESERLAAVDAELAEIKRLLKQQQQIQNQVVYPGIRPKNQPNMKTASTLAWIFPGMGHYYSGRTGKGLFYTSLELAALAGIAVTSSSYAEESENYNTALSDYDVIYNDVGATNDDVIAMQQAVTDAFNLKQEAMFTLIGAGTLSAGVWIWNILDVKKSQSKNYSSRDPVSIGINSRGQVEARLFF